MLPVSSVTVLSQGSPLKRPDPPSPAIEVTDLVKTYPDLYLPLSFLSTAFVAASLMPPWMASAARFNPTNWALFLGRAALTNSFAWQPVLLHAGCLLGLTALAMWLAVRTLRTYQKAV